MSMEGGIRKIEGMPEGWKNVKLGDAVEINGASRDPTREIPDEKILYIDIESVEGGTGIIKMAREILGKEAPSRARRIIHQNDVIMSTVRPYLKAFALVPREYNNQICSTGFAVLSCKNEISPRYLLYTLFSKKVIEQCNKMMMGGQYPALNQSQVAKIEIPLPPLPEQRRIAEVLGTVDSAIQKVDGAIEGTECLKKGLMQRLLTRGIGHKRFKFSKELGCEIPEEWNVRTLIDAVGEKNDLIVAGPFGSNLKVEDYRNEGIPIIRLQNIDYGRFVNKDIKYTSPEKANELSYHSFIKGDIVLAKLGDPIGKTCIVPDFLERGIVVADVVRIRIDEKILNKKFIMYILNSFYAFNQLTRGVIGSTRPRVNLDQIRDLFVPLPPLPEQRRIAEILGAVDRKLELERRRKEKLERVKKGLMNELLTGRKRVKVMAEMD